jgi:hypothetical protein
MFSHYQDSSQIWRQQIVRIDRGFSPSLPPDNHNHALDDHASEDKSSRLRTRAVGLTLGVSWQIQIVTLGTRTRWGQRQIAAQMRFFSDEIVSCHNTARFWKAPDTRAGRAVSLSTVRRMEGVQLKPIVGERGGRNFEETECRWPRRSGIFWPSSRDERVFQKLAKRAEGRVEGAARKEGPGGARLKQTFLRSSSFLPRSGWKHAYLSTIWPVLGASGLSLCAVGTSEGTSIVAPTVEARAGRGHAGPRTRGTRRARKDDWTTVIGRARTGAA